MLIGVEHPLPLQHHRLILGQGPCYKALRFEHSSLFAKVLSYKICFSWTIAAHLLAKTCQEVTTALHHESCKAGQNKGEPLTAKRAATDPSPTKRRHDDATTSRKKTAPDVSQGTKDFLAWVRFPAFHTKASLGPGRGSQVQAPCYHDP